jgi:hypothetical protein
VPCLASRLALTSRPLVPRLFQNEDDRRKNFSTSRGELAISSFSTMSKTHKKTPSINTDTKNKKNFDPPKKKIPNSVKLNSVQIPHTPSEQSDPSKQTHSPVLPHHHQHHYHRRRRRHQDRPPPPSQHHETPQPQTHPSHSH